MNNDGKFCYISPTGEENEIEKQPISNDEEEFDAVGLSEENEINEEQ